MQRRRLCTALLCALALSACSTSPAPVASAEHDGTADAIAAATAPPPPMEPAATLDSVVVASPAMAKQELDRYMFNAPGQAGSYFYGYSRLLQTRMDAELALGAKFDRLAFNNFVIGLVRKLGYHNLAAARRIFNARIAAQLPY